MNGLITDACKDLIDDASAGCANLFFDEPCLEILSKARNVLLDTQFR
jgi:hypothetical protein